MKNWEKELPEGYREALVIDAKDNKTFVRGMGLAALLVFAAFLWLGIFTQWSDMKTQEPSTRLLFFFCLSLIVYIVLHELVHGAAYKLLTGQKLTFGLTLSVAFCGVPEIYVYRKASLIAVLAPFVVFTVLSVLALFAVPDGWTKFYVLLFLGLHIGGCAGDLYNTWMYLTRFTDPRTLTRDTGPVQMFYVPEP